MQYKLLDSASVDHCQFIIGIIIRMKNFDTTLVKEKDVKSKLEGGRGKRLSCLEVALYNKMRNVNINNKRIKSISVSNLNCCDYE